MPLILPQGLPAAKVLMDENIFTMTPQRAVSQDIRPLDILIVNLMPDKVTTETQLARMLANSPLQVRLTLLRTGSHQSTHTPVEHMGAFYTTLREVKPNRYDGMIITGAPVELLAYEEIDYWSELCELIDFAQTNVYSTIYLCWAAMAGLYYHYGIPKRTLPQKLHGVFAHRVLRAATPLVRGFDETFYVPHSRHTEIAREDAARVKELRVIADSEEAGLHILSTDNGREIYLLGHMEYDRETLYNEYRRDTAAGMAPPPPRHYFADDDPKKDILFRWRAHGSLLYANWLNYYVYQETPYDLSKL